jgi:tripartite-type tricarboxylate transporter receptor subunit TctC
MMKSGMRLLATVALLLAALVPARAEWPDAPIRIVVPFAAGASTDIVVRTIAPRLSEILGQPVVVENRGGAGGLIGAQAVLNAPADGYTLFTATTSHTALPALHAKLPYDTLKDFAPIGILADMPGVIVVHPSVPVKTFKEFLDYAKTHTLTFGTAGAGTFPHLGIELLKNRAGIPMTHVPYKGAAPAMQDLLAGHIQVKLDAYVTSSAHMQAGKLRAIAVTSAGRIPELPDLPSVAESGFPGYEVSYWIGLVIRSEVPAPIRAKLEKAVMEAMNAENRAALTKRGVRPLGQSSKELDALIRRELVQWHDLVKKANITIN